MAASAPSAATNRNTVFSAFSFTSTLAGAAGALLAGVPELLVTTTGMSVADSYKPLFVLTSVLSVLTEVLILPVHDSVRRQAAGTRRQFLPRQSRKVIGRLALTNLLNGVGVGFYAPFIAYWFNVRYGEGPARIGFLIPLRQSYTMAVVAPEERSSAAGMSNLPSQVSAAPSPLVAGFLFETVSLELPFEIGTVLLFCNAALFFTLFRNLRPPEESSPPLSSARRRPQSTALPTPFSLPNAGIRVRRAPGLRRGQESVVSCDARRGGRRARHCSSGMQRPRRRTLFAGACYGAICQVSSESDPSEPSAYDCVSV